jgi:DNA-binding winged helix-turn-helix (wHTH) protein
MIGQPPARDGKVRFGVFEADLRTGELRKLGILIRLQSQPFKVLAILLTHPGEIVTRDELRLQIWGSETVVDFDHSLGSAVNKVREALCDSAERPHYIETLAKRGYRFAAPVQFVDDASADAAASPKPASSSPEAIILGGDQGAESRNEGRRMTISAAFALAVAGSLAIGLFSGAWLSRRDAQSKSDTAGKHRQLRAFWAEVLRSPEPPIVVFSNAVFVGRPETGLRYFNPEVDAHTPTEDLYTGVGEVLAIADLSDMLHSLNRSIVVKRSRLLTWDQTKNRDLVFVGSPSENLSLRDLPTSQDFVFRAMGRGEPRPGDLALVNVHPLPGEPGFFFASASLPLAEDYALVTLQPGPHPGQNMLMLAGTTTLGTQAATEFVCQDEDAGRLRARLGVTSTGDLPPFSAVLRVQVTGGVPVPIGIAAIRSHRK